jgi:uncharacterized protein
MAGKRMVMKTIGEDFTVELNDSGVADAIWLALPIEAYVNVWGEEIYFEIPVDLPIKNGKRELEIGDVAYWPQGNALCFFFGRTPVSRGNKPTAYSPVLVVGKVIDSIDGLKAVGDRTKVTVARL